MSIPVFFLALALSFSHLLAATPLDNWAEYPKPAGAGALNSVVFGNGIFVAGGNQGTIVTSTNGADWTTQTAGTTVDFGRLKFVNGKFFAISGRAFVSSNGVDWTPVSGFLDTGLPFSGDFTDITFGNGLYYATLTTGALLTSPDLTTWTSHSTPVRLLTLTYGNNMFVGAIDAMLAGNSQSKLATSRDTESWTSIGLGLDSRIGSAGEVTFLNGIFSAVCPGNIWINGGPGIGFPQGVDFVVILDGLGGLSRTLTLSAGYTRGKMAAGGQYYVFPDGGRVLYTTDLSAPWTEVFLPFSNPDSTYSDAVFGNEVFVALLSGHIFKSNPVTGSAPIRIIQQPLSVSINTGGTVILSVLAQGTDPITFQWRKNSQPIENATANTLTLTNVTLDSAGDYDVVITNPNGPLTSDKATVTVHFADVRFYAGVSLRGNIGDKFSVEYQDQIDPSGEWHLGSNVTLTETESVWYDRESANHTNRFYRATFIGH
jgi:hypothetical protein